MALLLRALALYILILNYQVVFMVVDLHFDRIEMLNETYLEEVFNFSQLRVSKFNRTVHIVNGDFESFVDLDRRFSVEAAFYFNRFNNMQYYKTPMRLVKTKMCEVYEKFGSEVERAVQKNFTNLHSATGKCPLKKVYQSCFH